MSTFANLTTDSAAARFDHALRHARKRCTAPDRPAPQPSAAWPKENSEPLSVDLFARAQLLALANRLAEPQLGLEMRLDLVEQLRCVLTGQTLESARRMSDVK
jgi:hypothetical protein